jgi:hypothetical protein
LTSAPSLTGDDGEGLAPGGAEQGLVPPIAAELEDIVHQARALERVCEKNTPPYTGNTQ